MNRINRYLGMLHLLLAFDSSFDTGFHKQPKRIFINQTKTLIINMRLISTLLVLLSAIAFIQTCTAEIAYDGLVMTSIDVKDIGNGKVEFSGQIKGTDDDTTSVILENVERVRWTGWRRQIPVFQANIVPDNKIKRSNLKPLLCIHGFNVQPGEYLYRNEYLFVWQ